MFEGREPTGLTLALAGCWRVAVHVRSQGRLDGGYSTLTMDGIILLAFEATVTEKKMNMLVKSLARTRVPRRCMAMASTRSNAFGLTSSHLLLNFTAM